MAVEVRLPLLGDVMQEGTLVEWLCADGARVAKGEALYRLETDKVSLDVEAPATGVLRQLVPAGAVVPVNGLLGHLLADGEQAARTRASHSRRLVPVSSRRRQSSWASGRYPFRWSHSLTLSQWATSFNPGKAIAMPNRPLGQLVL